MKSLYIVGVNYFDFKLVDAINRIEDSWKIEGFIDHQLPAAKKKYMGEYRYIGNYSIIPNLAAQSDVYFFNNKIHSDYTTKFLLSHPCKFATLVHPAIDMNRVEIGYNCVLPEGCVVGQNVNIGNFVKVATNSYISHDVKVEDHVFIGPHVTIGGNSILKKGCFIGMGAVIMNTTVGEKSIVGAGSVVIRKVPPRATVVGVPAKPIKRRK